MIIQCKFELTLMFKCLFTNVLLILGLVHLIVEFKLRLEFNLFFKQTNKHKQIFFLTRVQAPRKQLDSFMVNAPS